jgi:hypothetical protein
MNDEWTWEGKGSGTDAPALDETAASRGLRLKPNRSIELSSVTTRGATGAAVDLSVSKNASSFAAGFRFDYSPKDGKYRKLVIRDTGELTLYEFDGLEEKRVQSVPIGRKLVPGQWVELAYVAEAGDLVCFVAERPVLLVTASIPADRTLGFWSSADANFRLLRLRK